MHLPFPVIFRAYCCSCVRASRRAARSFAPVLLCFPMPGSAFSIDSAVPRRFYRPPSVLLFFTDLAVFYRPSRRLTDLGFRAIAFHAAAFSAAGFPNVPTVYHEIPRLSRYLRTKSQKVFSHALDASFFRTFQESADYTSGRVGQMSAKWTNSLLKCAAESGILSVRVNNSAQPHIENAIRRQIPVH